MLLNINKMSYDDKVLEDNVTGGAVLSSTEYNLLILSEEQKNIYEQWAIEMEKIPGVSCTEVGESPEIFGYCETWSPCEEIWPHMKALEILIDDIVYSVPPESIASPNRINKE